MKAGTVVLRYASALFAIAKEQNKVEDFGREVVFLGELFSDRLLQSFLRHPKIPAAEKKKLFLDKIAPHVSKTLQNFVALLFDRRRISVLEGIARAYQKISQEAMGEASGEVEAAKKLSDEELRNLEEAFSKRLKLKVKLSQKEQPSLIGGFRVTIGHRRFDGTVTSRLKELKSRLLWTPLDVE